MERPSTISGACPCCGTLNPACHVCNMTGTKPVPGCKGCRDTILVPAPEQNPWWGCRSCSKMVPLEFWLCNWCREGLRPEECREITESYWKRMND